MFTGLVEAKGAIVRTSPRGREARLSVRGKLDSLAREPLALGESIAIDGVCLTVAAISEPTVFEVDASAETLAKTTLGGLAQGAAVNLERAVALGARLGGHIVSGHVDGVGKVTSLTPSGAALEVVFEAPAELARFIAPKGSICVSGVSLTVNAVASNAFTVMLIPHTREKTSFDALAVGSPVNLEVDILARYVARLLERPAEPAPARVAGDEHLLDRLRAAGYA